MSRITQYRQGSDVQNNKHLMMNAEHVDLVAHGVGIAPAGHRLSARNRALPERRMFKIIQNFQIATRYTASQERAAAKCYGRGTCPS